MADLKIIICDVGNAASAIVKVPAGYSMMIDCGCNQEKNNPVDIFFSNLNWLQSEDYVTHSGVHYKLALLHITHPDDDHVRNAERVRKELTPYLVHRNNCSLFSDSDSINQDYKKYIDSIYNGNDPEIVNYGLDANEVFCIPFEEVQTNVKLNKKVRNNSSILRYIKYNGYRILFAGDLEKDGWEWLCNNDLRFIRLMKEGLDILIAPHHGHFSGFPKSLFDLTGNVRCVIHSKDSEANKDGTDVSSQYGDYCDGIEYKALSDNRFYKGKVLTTRSNGNIFLSVYNGTLDVWTSKASSNHERYCGKE
jgi:beta-lactamase superfamily II metal-dependent hydrolase